MKNIADFYPLSPMQQGMLFHSLYAPASDDLSARGVYVEQMACRLSGSLDVEALARAWQQVVDRHPVLRTGFTGEGLKEPVQVVHQQVRIPWIREDWSGEPPGTPVPPEQQEARLLAFMKSDREKGFNLARPPLIRLALIKTGPHSWQFVWTYHHILLDGWSVPMLLQEVFASYEALRQGRALLVPTPPPYRSYIAWLRRQDEKAAEIYWRGALAGLSAPAPLPVDWPSDSLVAGRHPQAGEAGPAYREETCWLPVEQSQPVLSLAQRSRITLSSVILGAWTILLSRYAGQEDVITGMTVSGRPPDLPDVEKMIGLFINTLPVRAAVTPETPVLPWLQALQAQLLEMRQYEYSPLVQVHGWSGISRSQPLFETLYVFENYPIQDSLGELHSSLVIDEIRSGEQTNFPLNLIAGSGGSGAGPGSERILLKLGYDTRRYQPATVRRLLDQLAVLLSGMAANPHQPIGRLPMLTPAGQQAVAEAWSRAVELPASPIHLERTFLDLFSDQVKRAPRAAAVRFEGRSLTYQQLDRQSNQLAHYLLQAGVTPGRLVGVCMDPSPEFITAILGILKAGAAYLPIDPSYPSERLAFMIADSQIQHLITQSGPPIPSPTGAAEQEDRTVSMPEIAAGVQFCLFLDTDWSKVARCPQTPPLVRVGPDDLAYAIYTSGSTGKPKASLLKHQGLSNLVQVGQSALPVKPADRYLLFYSISFDASVFDIFVTLSSGAALVIVPRQLKTSPDDLIALSSCENVTHLALPPALISLLNPTDFSTAKVLIVGGEAFPVEAARRWLQGGQLDLQGGPGRNGRPARKLRLFNVYGPTENTVVSTFHLIDTAAPGATHIPIGRPLPNTSAYILDEYLQPVPVGVPGELFLGGCQISAGYLNRPDLTREKFIDAPFSTSTQPGKLYRTGDQVRYRPDGAIEFLGRIDFQVKVRGFRIELGEIENALNQHPAVASAVVAAAAGRENRVSSSPAAGQAGDDATGPLELVAYAIPRPGASLLLSEIRAFLRGTLPEFMLPSSLVLLDTFPLTPNGKVNRRALPRPEQVERESARLGTPVPLPREIIEPRDELETRLRDIWQEAFNIRPISVRDNFFELGGHSLMAIRIMAQFRDQYNQESRAIPLALLFQNPTIETLAAAIRAPQDEEESPLVAIQPVPQENGSGDQPISGPPPIFFVHPSGGSVHWYTDLSQALGPQQPFYAFKARGLNGDRPIHTTIPEMAGYYLAALRRFKPHGPYHLGSWSMGVSIVYEMAQQLTAQGEQVELLAMLDQGPFLPNDVPTDDAEYLVETYGKQVRMKASRLSELSYDEMVAYLYEQGRKSLFITPDVSLAEFKHFVLMLRTHTEAWRSYNPQSYPGHITLFRAKKQKHGKEAGPDLGWGKLALGGVTVCEVPGDHLSLIHKPHVRVLANEIKKSMI